MSFNFSKDKLANLPFAAIGTVATVAFTSLFYAIFALKDVSAVAMWAVSSLIFFANKSKILNRNTCSKACKFTAFVLMLASFCASFFDFQLLTIFILALAFILFFSGWQSMRFALLPIAIWFGVFNYAQIHFLLSYPMRLSQTMLADVFLKLFNIQADVVGSSIFVSGKEIVITTACSGVEHLWVIILFAFIFADAKLKKGFDKFICVIASLPLFVICNALRIVFVIIAMRHFGDVVLNDATIHFLFGAITILVAMLLQVAFTLFFAKLLDKQETDK